MVDTPRHHRVHRFRWRMRSLQVNADENGKGWGQKRRSCLSVFKTGMKSSKSVSIMGQNERQETYTGLSQFATTTTAITNDNNNILLLLLIIIIMIITIIIVVVIVVISRNIYSGLPLAQSS